MCRILLLVACILSSVCLASCRSQARGRAEPATEDHPAAESRLQSSLPEGRAEAFFELETSGDQMAQPTKPARLVMVLRHGNTEQRVEISTCKEAALGSALGGGTETVLEVAGCGDFFSLETGAGFVDVRRLTSGEDRERVVRRPLPPGVERAVRPPGRD